MMLLDRRRFLLVVGLSVFAVPAQAQKHVPQAPRDIVVEIYEISAGKSGKYDGPSAFSDKKIRKLYFSKSLAAAVAAMEKKSAKANEPILDFDPITNSQDPLVKDLVIEDETKDDSKAVIIARFWSNDAKDASLVRYHFVKEGKAWKLDEITGNDRGDDKAAPWSLRAIMKGG